MFISSFWKELFRIQGTSLRFSTANHPQTDCQTEVVSRKLETYMRCFTSDHPKQWFKYVRLVEFCHNSTFHSAICMTPFEALYGRPPPRMTDYVTRRSNLLIIDQILQNRQAILSNLEHNLQTSKQKMALHANKHRRDCTFQEGDLVRL